MVFSGELTFLLIMIAALGLVLLGFTLGKYWIHTVVTILIVTTTFTAGKLITVFGVTASIATPIYAGIFLATDALHEFYGKAAARTAVWKGFLALIAVTVLGQLIASFPPVEGDAIGNGLSEVLSFIPNLFIGSALAYMISQNIDIRIYGYLKEKHPNLPLFVRNNSSTIVSQLIDSIIVYSIAFYYVPDLISIILVAWLFKIIVAIFDTPFIYAMKSFKERELNNTNTE